MREDNWMWKLCRLTHLTGYVLITNAMDQNPVSTIRHLRRFEEIFSLITIQVKLHHFAQSWSQVYDPPL